MVVLQTNKIFRNMSEKFSELVVVKKGGGSVVERPPLFSSTGKNLFVVWGNSVRSYNVETGDLVTIFSGLVKDAVGVALHPHDSDKLIAVSCAGEYIEWEYLSRGSCVRKIQLGPEDRTLVLKSFSLVTQQDDESLCIPCVVATAPDQDRAVVRTFCSTSGQERNLFPKIRVDNHNCSLAVRQSNGEILLAGFCNKPKTTLTFCISKSESETEITKTFSQNRMTCIACHPTDLCVITGDVTGCVRVWKNLLRKPVWTAYHWHTLPVQGLAFSDSGSYFYSGGGECVLVRWLLESPHHNRFVPRLSSEIAYVSISPGNTCIAVSTRDNGIVLVNSSLNVVNTIQHFSWYSSSAEKYLLPHEMTSDPRTKTLVMNARVGHLQFFSVDQGNLLFLLDVVGQNYLTQERSKVIKNTEVVKFAFNSDGSWLASVEFCEVEGKSPLELRLKFWEYNKVKQKYVLNTSVENPHRGKVNAIQFRPTTNNENLMCVTTGEDFKFRTWTLDESTNIYRKGCVWSSENVGFYRDLPVGALSFSTDGSLMAITFGPILTVWVPGANELKCSLTRPDTEEHLSHVEFGHGSCVHLVVTGSKVGLAVWNLLSVSLLWIVHFKLTVLVSDPVSDTMAAFSEENDVVIFSPNCLEPVFKQNCLIPHEESRVLNAVFIPHTRQKNSNISWQTGSQLFFFNSKQELLCLEHPTHHSEQEEVRNLDVLPTESFRPKTAYGALLAQQSQSDVIDTKKELYKHLGIPGFRTLRELVEAPAHAMPPLSLVGYSLLLNFISKTDTRPESRYRLRISEKDNDMEDSDDSDAEVSKEEQLSAPNLEQRKQDFIKKHQSPEETLSSLVLTEQSLVRIQKNSLEWVSDLLN